MYSLFAKYYDAFTLDVDYAARAQYLCSLIEKYGKGKGILLDLACGTGSMSFEMERLGFDVIGADISAPMLDEAMNKKIACGSNVMFLNQDMCALDLYGTITSCICTLDSINHLDSLQKVQEAFEKVSLFMEQGGVFLFDVNTAYKHREILGDNAFIFENDTCFLAWQNEAGANESVHMYLDFFERQGDTYLRESEEITEYYYSEAQLQSALETAGFALIGIFEDMSENAPTSISERNIFVCKKV